MQDNSILEKLCGLLEKNNVSIRTEALGGGGGGLCKLKDKTVFFVDIDAPDAETAAICAQAVNKIVAIDEIYIKPQIREFIEKSVKK